MRHASLFTLLTALICLSSGAPLKAAETTGWIAAIDHELDLLTLENGQTFALPDDINGAALRTGARVKITYSETAGGRTVSCVALESSARAGRDRLPEGPETEFCSGLTVLPAVPRPPKSLERGRSGLRYN